MIVSTDRAASGARLAAVSHRYRDTLALDAVDLEIPAGGVTGFIGPDAVGKSTLLAIIAGARRLQGGTVEVLGGDIGDPRYRRALLPRIAYMPQGLGQNLYPTLSVAENVDFFGRVFGVAPARRERRMRDLLAATGLLAFISRRASQLSGGMKQKLGLCCALIHEPDLLILDEPTTGVDPLSRTQFWELIGRIRSARPGMSVLVATAYMEEAEHFDWLILMDAGHILATGPPDALEASTATNTLEAAYVALLPAERRRGHRVFVVPPRARGFEEPAVEARALTRRFGAFTAVDRVSFSIDRGEIFGFVGPNGCGKTTTMKMLTGLLPASEGEARLFGRVVDATDVGQRKRLGYMSQTFSLYGELTVRHNLELHARLFDLPEAEIASRVSESIDHFGLDRVVHRRAETLPLGVRQRLSLAVATIHRPAILILDEPTSGVDPIARDQFWQLLIDLSRARGATIFVSTHYLSEASRCDRIALMNAGRVLACDAPSALARRAGAATVEEAFIAYIKDDPRQPAETASGAVGTGLASPPPRGERLPSPVFDPRRLWAVARREILEICRDPIRLLFAFLVPSLLLIVFGYGLSLDVERVPYGALDQDRTPESRAYLEQFEGSRYFAEQAPVGSRAELDRRLRQGEIALGIEIPSGFGRDIERGRRPDVGIWIDGTMPFRAETVRGYVEALHAAYRAEQARSTSNAVPRIPAARIQTRFRYNQAMKSRFAIIPGLIAVVLVIVPSILTAVGVVREKELGSITNLYATPLTRLEFLWGKQLPYVGISMLNFLALGALAVLLFAVPFKGSFPALAIGALLYVTASTAIGLLVSAFTRTQIAGLIATIILTIIPAFQYSGLFSPIATLNGSAALLAHAFPAAYFLNISVATFAKALGTNDLLFNYAALVATIAVLTVSCVFFLDEQDV